MSESIQAPFRFLSDEEYSALDVRGKAIYLIRAQRQLKVQYDVLTRYRESFAKQVAAIVELGGGDLQLPDSDSLQ